MIISALEVILQYVLEIAFFIYRLDISEEKPGFSPDMRKSVSSVCSGRKGRFHHHRLSTFGFFTELVEKNVNTHRISWRMQGTLGPLKKQGLSEMEKTNKQKHDLIILFWALLLIHSFIQQIQSPLDVRQSH